MSTPSQPTSTTPRRSGPSTTTIVIGSVVLVGGILAFALSQKGGQETAPAANAPVTLGNMPAQLGGPLPQSAGQAPPGQPPAGNAQGEALVIPPPAPQPDAPKQGGTVSGKFTAPKPAVNRGDLPPDHPPITADESTQVGIQWHGYSCFYIHSPGKVVVVTDPFDPRATGLPDPGVRGHLVASSLNDPSHSFVQGVQPFQDEHTLKPLPLKVVGPGGASQGDVQVTPTRGTFGAGHLIQAGSLRIAHLGGVQSPLSPAQITALGKVDILMIPVGGGLSPKQAVALTKAINPAIVIPMAFATPDMEGAASKLPPADAFISASPYAVTRKDSDVMLISKTELPASTEIFLLRYGH